MQRRTDDGCLTDLLWHDLRVYAIITTETVILGEIERTKRKRGDGNEHGTVNDR